MRSAPDGYTLLFATNSAMLAVPAPRKTPPYDPLSDFTPVSLVGRFGFFVFVHPGLPARNVQELLAYVRANPGLVNYGTGNSSSLLATAQLARQEKLNMVHVPYKGDAPLTGDLLAGRIHLAVATAGTTLAHVNEGKLRVLATLLPVRSALVPDAPTVPAAGVNGLNITPWAAVFGPAKLPRDITDRIARAAKRAGATGRQGAVEPLRVRGAKCIPAGAWRLREGPVRRVEPNGAGRGYRAGVRCTLRVGSTHRRPACLRRRWCRRPRS